MVEISPPEEQSQIVNFAGHLIQQTSKIHMNLEQDFILTTEDKLRLSLAKHFTRMEQKKAWLTPLGILLTIIVVFPTTEFKLFVFSADTWQAAFIISAGLASIWLVKAVYQARISSTTDDLITEIKRNAIAHENSGTEIDLQH